MTVQVRYHMEHKIEFVAVRQIEDLEGFNFEAVIRCSCEKLTGSEVVSRAHLSDVISSTFNHSNLNEKLTPAIPTTENLARAVGQVVLDYLFRMELDTVVRLEMVRVSERPGELIEIRYTHSKE